MRVPNTLVKKMGIMLKVASDQTRIKIMLCLLDPTKCTCKCKGSGECAKCSCLSCMIAKKVNDIALEIGASQSLVSHQLKTLKKAGFVRSKKQGTSVYYSLKDGHVKEILSLVIEHIDEA